MKNRKNIISVLAAVLTILLVLTGCAESGDTFVSTGSARIIFRDAESRSIRPDIPEADSYQITFSRADAESSWPVPEVISVKSAEVPQGGVLVSGVHVGSYTVNVKGLDLAGKTIMEGTSEAFEVTANNEAKARVKLGLMVTEGFNGKLSVTIDWSAVADQRGPLQDAVAAGSLTLTPVLLEEGPVAGWPGALTVSGLSGQTSATFTFDVPARVEPYSVLFELSDNAGETRQVFYSVRSEAEIRSGITSVPVEGTSGAFILTSENVPSVGSAPIILGKDGYELSRQNPQNEIRIRLGIHQDALKVLFSIKDVTVSSDIVKDEERTVSIDRQDSILYTVGGFSVGHMYDISLQVVYPNGIKSPVVEDARLRGVKTMTPVASVSIDGGYETAMDTNALPFQLTARLNPASASLQNGTWTFSRAGVLNTAEGSSTSTTGSVHNISLVPGTPGKTTVTFTSEDTFNGTQSATTTEFTVRLASPVEVTAAKEAEGLGIVVSWNAGDGAKFSDRYEIQRKASGEEGFTTLKDNIEASAVVKAAGSYSYTDKALEGGKSYEYRVVAKSSIYKDADLNSLPSATTSPVTAVRVAQATDVAAALLKDQKGVKLTWTAGDTVSDKYVIGRNDGTSWNEEYATVSSATEYVDTAIEAGKTYQYHVYAKSTAYPGAGFDAPVSADTSVLAKLASVDKPSAVLGEKSITVTWTANALADTYTVTRNDGVTATLSNGETSYEDRDITRGASYTYTVTAKNSNYPEEGFDAPASAASDAVVVPNKDVTVEIEKPSNGPTASITGPSAAVTKTAGQDFTVSAVAGAESYTWYLDESNVPFRSGADLRTVTVSYDDVQKTETGYSSRVKHTITVVTSNGVSATTSFEVSYFEIRHSAPETRLPLNYGDIYLWTEASSSSDYSFTIKSVIRDGVQLEAQKFAEVATIDEWGLLTLRSYGDITIEATNGAQDKAEITFSIYDPTVTDIKKFISTVNSGIYPTFKALATNFEGDWNADTVFGQATVESGSSNATRVNGSHGDAQFNLNAISFTDADGNAMTANSNTIYVATKATENITDYTGLNWLERFGNTTDASKPDTSKNTITVTLPGNQGTAKICYMNQLLRTPNTGNYFVMFSNDCGTYSEADGYQFRKGVWSESIANDASITDQIQFRHPGK